MTKSRDGGSGADFEAMVRPHVDQLYRVAYRFTGRREDAEDLVQEVLAKLYPRRQQLETVDQLGPWLTRVLYRQFIDNRRKKARLRLLENEAGAADPFDNMPSEARETETEVLARRDRSRLERALDGLNPDQRAVIVLHDMEGYTLVELSETLEAPTGTLKSRLHRARARLRKILGREGTL
ncbi:RNA polymerase sigma factor [Thiohalorhabdus sp.]|uniref:RNA polymerase sigma factor n=1 Tax=Thiohalorhabdus sp. TaxID=3094134 RepID=UPI002FC36AA3